MGDDIAECRVSLHRFPSRFYRWLNKPNGQGRKVVIRQLGGHEGDTFRITFLPRATMSSRTHIAYDLIYSRRKERKRFLNPFYSKIMSESDEA